ncbi:hypothetical protein [Methanocaldococcus vulcanius]|nr:hypothetical protein [Methanocaldococcus vulcanius]
MQQDNLKFVELDFVEIMKRIVARGVDTWENKKPNRAFLSKDERVILVPRALVEEFIPEAPHLLGYTTQKLLRDLRKLEDSPIVEVLGTAYPIKIPDESGRKVSVRPWPIKREWLEKRGVKIK